MDKRYTYPDRSDSDWQYFEEYLFIKPMQSIQHIRLNIIATKTGIEFEEIVGSFKNE
jgi:hypothetical protein